MEMRPPEAGSTGCIDYPRQACAGAASPGHWLPCGHAAPDCLEQRLAAVYLALVCILCTFDMLACSAMLLGHSRAGKAAGRFINARRFLMGCLTAAQQLATLWFCSHGLV